MDMPFTSEIDTPHGVLLITQFTTASGMATIGSPECRKVRINAMNWVLFDENDYELGHMSCVYVMGYLKMLPRPQTSTIQ